MCAIGLAVQKLWIMNMHSISNFLKTVSTALLNLLLVEYISIVEAGMEAEGQVLRSWRRGNEGEWGVDMTAANCVQILIFRPCK